MKKIFTTEPFPYSHHKQLLDYSLKELYDEHWEFLYEFSYAKTGSREDSFDLVQDLFVYVWENRERIRIATTLKAYFIGYLRNKVFDIYREKGIHKKVDQDFALYFEPSEPDEWHLKYTEANKAKTREFLQTALQQLPEKMQYIVKERWYNKKAIDEISAELSISRQTVKNTLTLALKKMRAHADVCDLEIVFVWMICFGILIVTNV